MITPSTTTRPGSVVAAVSISIVMTVVSLFSVGAVMLAARDDADLRSGPVPDSDGGIYAALAFALLVSAVGVWAAVRSLARSERWRSVLVGLTVLTLLFSVLNLFSAWRAGSGFAAFLALVWIVGAATVLGLIQSVRSRAWFEDPFLPE